jgi:flavodoxin
MNRRLLLKGSLVLGGGLLGSHIVGCSPSAPTPATTQPRVAPEASSVPGPSKVLLAYFSRAGENYHYGDRIDLDVGNTEIVADMIAAAVGADVYRIEAADPYPHDYEETVERNKHEQDDDARPAIAGRLPAVSNYDTVLLGSPIWNVRPPMIMRTFIDGVDLSGKVIHPFLTYAVSGMGNTVDEYTRACPDSPIKGRARSARRTGSRRRNRGA